MTQARKQLIDISATPFYHCVNRCVRRAFLYGEDRYTKKSFNHRKQWLVDRFKFLSEVFSINVAAYAVMSNHYHLVLHVDSEKAKVWSDLEVVERWKLLYQGNLIVERWLANEPLCDAEMDVVKESIEKWRGRLMDISWYMRCLNEYIALKANKEDSCKGRFWEGRFKSQALMDEPALLACMIYVDLNPIRAGIDKDLEHSEFTSILDRIKRYKQAVSDTNDTEQVKSQPAQPKSLLPFSGGISDKDNKPTLPFPLYDYLELCDWSGRAIRTDKSGAIDEKAPKLLTQLGLTNEDWLKTLNRFTHHYGGIIGHWNTLCELKEKFHQHWLKGARAGKNLYPSPS